MIFGLWLRIVSCLMSHVFSSCEFQTWRYKEQVSPTGNFINLQQWSIPSIDYNISFLIFYCWFCILTSIVLTKLNKKKQINQQTFIFFQVNTMNTNSKDLKMSSTFKHFCIPLFFITKMNVHVYNFNSFYYW